MTQKQQQLYHALVTLSILLIIIVPVQIKVFWYSLRIIVLSTIILFLKYMAKSTDMESRYRITFKSYFWLGILIYLIYRQYSVTNILYLSILFIGYISVLGISFVYGKKIKWSNSSIFLVIESGLLAFRIFDMFH